MQENFPIITDFEAHLNNSRYFLYISIIDLESIIVTAILQILHK